MKLPLAVKCFSSLVDFFVSSTVGDVKVDVQVGLFLLFCGFYEKCIRDRKFFISTMAEMMILHEPKFYAERRTARPADSRKLYRFEEENVAWLAAHTNKGSSSTVLSTTISTYDKFAEYRR